MEELKSIDIEKVCERLENYVKKGFPHLFAITGKMGVQMGDKRWYWEKAKKAAETKKYQREGENIWWLPIYWHNQFICVCGIKEHKTFPKEESLALQGLVDELVYDLFLEKQINLTYDHRSNFIKELLETNHFKNFEEAIDRGDILGINLRAPQAVILLKTPGLMQLFKDKLKGKAEEDLPVLITKECQHFLHKLEIGFDSYEQNIFACIGPDTFVVLKWARGEVNTLNSINFFRQKANYIKEMTEKITGIVPTIGVGQYYPGLQGLRKSYADAKTALELGEKIWGSGSVYHITDIGMFISFSPKVTFDRKCELSYQIMGKIFNDVSLYKTVNAFLENDMNLSEAATKLHLHRNTLIYRLDKIKKTIGLDPRKFSDAVQLKLGLILYTPTKQK